MATGPIPALPPNPVVDPSDPGYPSADNAARNQAAQMQRFADKLNTDNYALYKGLIDGYQYSLNAGRPPATNPPAPPLKYGVRDGALVLTDEAMAVIPISQPVQLQSGLAGGGIVGTPEGTTDIGPARGNGDYSCGPRDTNPVGKIITLPDGSKIRKVSWGPFGFFYEHV